MQILLIILLFATAALLTLNEMVNRKSKFLSKPLLITIFSIVLLILLIFTIFLVPSESESKLFSWKTSL